MRARAEAIVARLDKAEKDADREHNAKADESDRRYRAKAAEADVAYWEGMTHEFNAAARLLREALAAEAAPTVSPRKTMFVSADVIAGIRSPMGDPREIPEAGPGLWIVVAIVRIGGEPTYRIEVEPIAVSP